MNIDEPRPAGPEPGSLRVDQWITPLDTGELAEADRRRGHHRLQIAVDTMAYAHNIPLRLLLPDRLQALPGVVAGLLRDESVQAVLASDAPEMAAADHASLASPDLLALARDWILGTPKSKAAPPAALPAHWLQGALALLPYVERKVWLTEMGNPLPAHALCRMQDHWALYVLMWTWRHADVLSEPHTVTGAVFGVAGLEVRTLRPFDLTRPDGRLQQCLPVVGPYFVSDETTETQHRHESFCDSFGHFVENIVEIDRDRDGRSHTVPLREELADALSTRLGLTPTEASLRAETASHTLDLLRNARLADLDFANGMSRAEWEVVSALCSWLARWDDALVLALAPGQQVLLNHDGDIPALLVQRDDSPDAERRRQPRVKVEVVRRTDAPATVSPLVEVLQRVDATHRDTLRSPEFDAFRVDRPERYFSRIRERQNAMWSSQVIAINNLLSRHGPREVYIGADEFEPEDADGRGTVRYDEAEHLLRGFGSRICRYLVSMTRADAATIHWLDYAQAPPRLLPAGDYARHAMHRAQGHAIWERFDRWAWAPGPEPSNTCPANRRAASSSQTYRVAATGVEDPLPCDNASAMGASPEQRRKRIVPVPEGEDLFVDPAGDAVTAYFANYPKPQPRDGLAAPLLVNGRVIGVVSLLGLVEGQFEPRLFWPLRRAASLVAACMNHQSQVWHMRRLNYLFARRGLHEFQRQARGAAHSPLRDVSRCLANMFLCPAAHIWLQSPVNENRFELRGYNWDGLFRHDDKPAGFAREFTHVGPDAVDRPPFRPFSSMAIDLARDPATMANPLGRFVQGFYDAQAAATVGYDAETASRRGTHLGRDYHDHALAGDDSPATCTRARIFGGPDQGGYGLLDIMSFALVSPAEGGWTTVGVVTLHDKGDAMREPLRQCLPWDRGWASVVAHVQTYLPYLFKQAEVLHNPDVDARRYLIHAGRAELIAVRDNMIRLRQRLESTLAPGRGVREMIDRVMSPDFQGDYRQELRRAQVTVSEAWEALGLAASPSSEQNLRQLANVMHEYRELSRLPGVEMTARNQRVRLHDLLEDLVLGFAHEFKHRRSRRSEVPEHLELNLPGQWLRIVLRDLIHNAAKYATGDSFTMSWDASARCLSLVNEGPYQSTFDRPELLLAAGGQGSAGRISRDNAQDRARGSDSRGHGLGLWGAKLLCGVMDIGFSIEARPMSATLRTDDHGVQTGTARYFVKLVFPQAALSGARGPAPKGFY